MRSLPLSISSHNSIFIEVSIAKGWISLLSSLRHSLLTSPAYAKYNWYQCFAYNQYSVRSIGICLSGSERHERSPYPLISATRQRDRELCSAPGPDNFYLGVAAMYGNDPYQVRTKGRGNSFYSFYMLYA